MCAALEVQCRNSLARQTAVHTEMAAIFKGSSSRSRRLQSIDPCDERSRVYTGRDKSVIPEIVGPSMQLLTLTIVYLRKERFSVGYLNLVV